MNQQIQFKSKSRITLTIRAKSENGEDSFRDLNFAKGEILEITKIVDVWTERPNRYQKLFCSIHVGDNKFIEALPASCFFLSIPTENGNVAASLSPYTLSE